MIISVSILLHPLAKTSVTRHDGLLLTKFFPSNPSLFSEIGSHSGTQAGLKLGTILLPQTPMCWEQSLSYCLNSIQHACSAYTQKCFFNNRPFVFSSFKLVLNFIQSQPLCSPTIHHDLTYDMRSWEISHKGIFFFLSCFFYFVCF